MTVAKVCLHCILKGNTSRFGAIIQVLPSNIWEYFKLGFIILVVVFIIFNLFFLFYIQKLLYVMYTTFVIQKLSFVEFLLSEIKFYLLILSRSGTIQNSSQWVLLNLKTGLQSSEVATKGGL